MDETHLRGMIGNNMSVSVAVVPRERFSPLLPSLLSLFETIDETIPVIVVDGGAPENIRSELRKLRNKRHFTLVENEEFILPGAARNMALDLVATRYVAFCDNDIEYTDGWLEALVKNAEKNTAAAVSPVTLVGPSDPPMIHHAGGDLFVTIDAKGRRDIRERHRLAGKQLRQLDELRAEQAPLIHTHFEYHCVLMDTKFIKDIGGLDERLVIHEHLDSSLRILMNGGLMTFESKSLITYQALVEYEGEDWPYFLFRWAKHRGITSDRVIAENWGLHENPEKTPNGWLNKHRDRAMLTVVPAPIKKLFRGKAKNILLALIRPSIERFDTRQADGASPHTPPRPPVDAVDKLDLGSTDKAKAA